MNTFNFSYNLLNKINKKVIKIDSKFLSDKNCETINECCNIIENAETPHEYMKCYSSAIDMYYHLPRKDLVRIKTDYANRGCVSFYFLERIHYNTAIFYPEEPPENYEARKDYDFPCCEKVYDSGDLYVNGHEIPKPPTHKLVQYFEIYRIKWKEDVAMTQYNMPIRYDHDVNTNSYKGFAIHTFSKNAQLASFKIKRALWESSDHYCNIRLSVNQSSGNQISFAGSFNAHFNTTWDYNTSCYEFSGPIVSLLKRSEYGDIYVEELLGYASYGWTSIFTGSIAL